MRVRFKAMVTDTVTVLVMVSVCEFFAQNNDVLNVCLICNQTRESLNRRGESFEKHVSGIHNVSYASCTANHHSSVCILSLS